MPTHYVLIDYENVQPKTLAALETVEFRVLLLVGANQPKVRYEVAAAMQRFGPRAEYIKISGSGRNALDFHIAYYIGHLSARDKSAHFHIISHDTGFDPLIHHLRSRKVWAVRSRKIEEMPMFKASQCQTLPDRVSVAVSCLMQQGTSKPRTVKTLTRAITSLFRYELPDEEVSEIVTQLQSKGYVAVNENKVSYALPQNSA